MATLYTPEAKTTGLDWLAGMVQNGQQLWQRERSLQQEAQRLQVAKQQQALQAQQFWATQARLKEQEDFQNRKFLYSAGQDQREFAWKQTQADRNYNLQARQEDRLTAGQVYAQDPNSLPNKNMAANTEAAQARAEQDRAETAIIGKNPMDWLAPAPADGTVDQGPDASLLPKADGTGFTGNSANPYNGKTSTGRSYSIVPGSITSRGITYQTVMDPVTKPVDQKKAQLDAVNKERAQLSSLSRSKKSLPSYPTGPNGDNPTPAQVKAYEQRVAEVEKTNATINREIAQVATDLNIKTAKARMMDANLDIQVTPAFQGVAPMFFDAITRKDPMALENLRVQIKPLADDKDPAATKALKFLDYILGEDTSSDKGLRTGGSYYLPPK